MSECPFANFPNMIDPDTYVNGMPYETLHEIRKSGPVHWMDGSYEGVPYWLVTGRDEIDFVSKSPELFSSEQGLRYVGPRAMGYDLDPVDPLEAGAS